MINIRNIYFKYKWQKQVKKLNYIGVNSIVRGPFTVYGSDKIIIGNNFKAGSGLILQTWETYQGEKTGYKPELKIGDNVTLSPNIQISCLCSVTIGNGVLMGNGVFICDNSHGNTNFISDVAPCDRKLEYGGRVIIGDNVWIGKNVCILPNVSIGEGAIIGANAVVTHDIPDFSVAAGVPAKVIKEMKRKDRK